jgi:hypothetical protein
VAINNILAFEGFLEHLHRQGFIIGVDHHIRLQQLLNRIGGECSPSDLSTILCPIFATDEDQQERFYKIFDLHFEIFNSPSQARGTDNTAVDWHPLVLKGYEPIPINRWPYFVAASLAVAFVFAVVWLMTPAPVLKNQRREINS